MKVQNRNAKPEVRPFSPDRFQIPVCLEHHCNNHLLLYQYFREEFLTQKPSALKRESIHSKMPQWMEELLNSKVPEGIQNFELQLLKIKEQVLKGIEKLIQFCQQQQQRLSNDLKELSACMANCSIQQSLCDKENHRSSLLTVSKEQFIDCLKFRFKYRLSRPLFILQKISNKIATVLFEERSQICFLKHAKIDKASIQFISERKFNSATLPHELRGIRGDSNQLLELKSCHLYFGEVQGIKRHGIGFMIDLNSKRLHYGIWTHDELRWGHQLCKNSQEKLVLAQGYFQDLILTGEAKIWRIDGLVYIGNVVKGKIQGKGKLLGQNDEVLYEGDFVQGQKEGYGIEMQNNQIFEGYFLKGAKHGEGKSIVNDEIEIGLYSEDNKVGRHLVFKKANPNVAFKSKIYDQSGNLLEINVLSSE